MSRFLRFVGSHRRSIACLGLLSGAATGCEDVRHRTAQSEIVSNDDVAQIQPVVHSHSFTMNNIDATRQLAAGIYGVENNRWRWTAGDFSIVLATPRTAPVRGADLVLTFYIPEAIVSRIGPVTLTADLNQMKVGMTTYKTAGAQHFSALIPQDLLTQSPAAIDFHLDRCVRAGVLESRELGFIIESISLEAHENR